MTTTYWADIVMKAMYVDTTTEFYLGLSSTKPGADGLGATEPKGGSYARVKIGKFESIGGGSVRNTSEAAFPESKAAWFPSSGKAAYWLVYDGAGSAAHLLSCGELSIARTVESGTTVIVPANSIVISLDDSGA